MSNAEARFNKSFRPRKPEGSLGRTAQDVHLDSHTAPELCAQGGFFSSSPGSQRLQLGKVVSLPVAHLLSATVRVYSLVAPCCLPDLTSLALLGSVSGQRGLSRGPLPGYKTVSKWRLQLQDSTPFLLLSQRFCTTLHTSASLGCYLLFTHMPDCPLAPLGQV